MSETSMAEIQWIIFKIILWENTLTQLSESDLLKRYRALKDKVMPSIIISKIYVPV